jgi:hypothetical protein
VLLARVRRERLPLELSWLLQYDGLREAAEASGAVWTGPATKRGLYRTWLAGIREFKETHSSEGGGVQALISGLNRIDRTRAVLAKAQPCPLPAEFAGLAPERVRDLQQTPQWLMLRPPYAAAIRDSKASDGVAVTMPGTHVQWAIQPPMPADLSGKWEVFAAVRVRPYAAAAKSAGAFTWGLYDYGASRMEASATASVGESEGDEYRLLSLGVHPINGRMRVWFAPMANDTVRQIAVDRVILVRRD